MNTEPLMLRKAQALRAIALMFLMVVCWLVVSAAWAPTPHGDTEAALRPRAGAQTAAVHGDR